MTRATVLPEVRQMRFEELYARQQRRELTMIEAAEMLGVTARGTSLARLSLKEQGNARSCR